MQGSFFSQRRPNYVNYGSYGTLVGWSIANSLMHVKSHRNNYENLLQFLDDSVEQAYSNASNIYNVSSQAIKPIIMDVIAVKIAYLAYKDWIKRHNELGLPFIKLSPLQTFWVAFAQNYCLKIDGD